MDLPADGGAEVLQSPPRRTGRAHTPDPAADRSFSRTLLLTVAGAVIPGLGLIAARRRVIGSIVLGIFVSGLVVLGVWAAADPQGVRAMAVQPSMLIGDDLSEAEVVSEHMRRAWTRFAADGDPGWPAYDDRERLTWVVDAVPAVAPYPEDTSRRIWQDHAFSALPLVSPASV